MPDSLQQRLRRSVSILIRGEEKPASPALSIPPLTQADVAEIREFFPMQKYFILGHARSGTTLLARLVRLHPQVHCNWQAHFFTREEGLTLLAGSPEAQEWLMRRSNRWNHGQNLSSTMMRIAADFIMERDARRAGKTIVGDKSPSSAIHGEAVRTMYDIYPDAALVYIVRDGRDVLVSQRFRNFVEGKNLSPTDLHILDELRQDQAPFTNGTRSMFSEDFIRRYAQSWVDDVTEIEAEGRRLYDDRYVSLRYEDLLAQPFSEMQRVWQVLGTDIEPTLAASVQAEMRVNPDEEWQEEKDASIADFLPKGKAGNWRSLFTERDRALFKSIAGDLLVKWDYEKDSNW
jgi:hypothetical protein